jgi:methyl-accepting chemotaxis protein
MPRLPRFSSPLSRLRIGSRMAAAFGTVLLLTAVLGSASVLNLARVNQTSGDLAGKWLPSVTGTAAARVAALSFRDLESKHAHTTDPSYHAEYEDKMKEALAALGTEAARLGTLASSPEERNLVGGFNAKWAEYQAVSAKVVQLGQADKAADAREISEGAGKMNADDVIAALDLLAAYHVEGSKQAAVNAAAVYAQARTVTLGLVGGMCLLAVGLGVALTRSITRPLGQAVDAANAVAEGNLAFEIADSGHDEVAFLLKRLAQMQGNLRQRQGDDELRMAQSERQRLAATQVADEIGGAVDHAIRGDFAHRIGLDGKEALHA